MSPIRRDGDGRLEAGSTWESLIERQIRESMDAGDFDALPFHGERIPIDDDGTEMALAHHVLKQAGATPDWIATDLEIRELLDRRDSLVARARRRGAPVTTADRTALADIVGRVNSLILRLEHEAPSTRQHRRRLHLESEVAVLEAEVLRSRTER